VSEHQNCIKQKFGIAFKFKQNYLYSPKISMQLLCIGIHIIYIIYRCNINSYADITKISTVNYTMTMVSRIKLTLSLLISFIYEYFKKSFIL